MAEPPRPGQSATDWTLEQTRALLRLASDPESFKEVDKVTQIIAGLMNGTLWSNREAARDELLAKIQQTMKEAGNAVGGALGTVISTFYGVDAIGNSVGEIASGGGTAAARKAAGDAVVAAIFGIFNLTGVARGYLNREPGTEEQQNFARFVGMNWQLQIADLIAEMAARWVPWDVMGGVKEIGDRVQKILGLEDAQEEIMEPLMEKLIIAGLEKRFNRDTLPTDLSANDAVSAHIRDLITPLAYKMILDNEGVRTDVRDVLVQLQAKNLTEADFRDLYQRGVWTQAQVKAAFRGNGYLEADAETKTSLVIQDREWMLRKELLNVWESQFVHGVIDEPSFRASLGTLYFSAVEEDLEIEIAKGKASMGGAAKPKKIAGSFNVAPWRVKDGASAVMSWNIRNADTITISGIGAVGPRGEILIQPTASGTYTLDASNATDSAQFEAVVEVGGIVAPKPPGASLSAQPRNITIFEPVELRWSTTNADAVSIDGIGGVAEQGVQAVYPLVSTTYTLRATNAAGTTIRQDLVFVSLPSFPGGNLDLPTISFSISPSTVSPARPQAELSWSITKADEGELTYPDGRKKKVNVNGAEIVTATESGIYTISAKNANGEAQKQEGLIFQTP